MVDGYTRIPDQGPMLMAHGLDFRALRIPLLQRNVDANSTSGKADVGGLGCEGKYCRGINNYQDYRPRFRI